MTTSETWPPKCGGCGRFIGIGEMFDGSARFVFTPDNEFGPEETEWICRNCGADEQAREPACNPVWLT